MNQLPRRALSRYGLTFQGNILSVNCQCRMLTRVRRTHSTSPVENSLITNLSFVGYLLTRVRKIPCGYRENGNGICSASDDVFWTGPEF